VIVFLINDEGGRSPLPGLIPVGSVSMVWISPCFLRLVVVGGSVIAAPFVDANAKLSWPTECN